MLAFLSALLLLLPALVLAASRTSPPSGALVVRKSGTQAGEYSTIGAAIKAAGSGTSSSSLTIFVYPGEYKEHVVVDRAGKFKLMGYTADTKDFTKNQVTITAGVSAAQAGNNDASGTLRVRQAVFGLYNINVVNSFGKGSQAIALSAQGTKQGYYACQFRGYQDTVLTNEGLHWFSYSFIQGATDYIFGQRSSAVFKSCTIESTAPGWITASGRSTNDAGGYLFDSCKIQQATGAASGNYWLGRPWRPYAKVKFQKSSIGGFIKAEGWDRWNGGTDVANIEYAEFGNTGDGADTSKRASFSRVDSSATAFKDLLGGDYTSWVDPLYL